MASHDAGAGLSEARRKALFLTVVAVQDQELNVALSQKSVPAASTPLGGRPGKSRRRG